MTCGASPGSPTYLEPSVLGRRDLGEKRRNRVRSRSAAAEKGGGSHHLLR